MLEIREILETLYEYRDDETQLEIEKAKFAKKIKALGISKSDFKNIWLAFVREKTPPEKIVYRTTEIEAPKGYASLYTNSWETDGKSIYRMTEFGRAEASCHPILPVERLTNIDTEMQKLKVAFKSNSHWQEVIADRSVFTSANSIMQLSNNGVRMSQDTAKDLVRYLYEIERDNDNIIPYRQSIGRMGWIKNHGFSPYDNDFVFDGESSFKQVFEAMQTNGKRQKWIDCMKEIRTNGVTARILLASSFASILIEPLKKLPFVVHLWGQTGGGKTVSLLMAASVWGNPNEGYLMRNFNSTQVGLELTATVFNSIPLCINELQITKETNMDKQIYQLCEGSGRTRGNKSLGVSRVGTWHNCMLTNGEQPITVNNSGGGVVNRIIEVECKEDIFQDPVKVSNIVRDNYGFAGKEFVEYVKNNIDEIKTKYDKIYAKLAESDAADKQIMAAALIVTADLFATKLFFNDKNNLRISEIVGFLSSKSQVSATERAYDFLKGWVSMNHQRFEEVEIIERWGRFSESKDTVYIVSSKFEEILRKEGYHAKPVLSWLAEQGLIEWSRPGYKKNYRISPGGSSITCIALRLKQDFEPVEIDDLPFK